MRALDSERATRGEPSKIIGKWKELSAKMAPGVGKWTAGRRRRRTESGRWPAERGGSEDNVMSRAHILLLAAAALQLAGAHQSQQQQVGNLESSGKCQEVLAADEH